MGRPSMALDERKVTMSFCLDRKLAEWIETRAKLEKLPKSQFVERELAVRKALHKS